MSKKFKKKFENKIIEWLIFLYFNFRNFEISKYRLFYISSLQILTPSPPRNFEMFFHYVYKYCVSEIFYNVKYRISKFFRILFSADTFHAESERVPFKESIFSIYIEGSLLGYIHSFVWQPGKNSFSFQKTNGKCSKCMT